MLAAASCQKPEIDAVDPVRAGATNPDWTEASHGNDVSPDHTTVFPQDKVNTLEITMTAQEWQTIQTDMAAKFGGSFGARANAGPGGGGPGGWWRRWHYVQHGRPGLRGFARKIQRQNLDEGGFPPERQFQP